MTREFLKQLGIEDKTVIDSIMDENGRDINSEKARLGGYETLKTQLADANKKIEELGKLDFDGVKAMADDYKAKFEQAQTESKMQLEALRFDYALDGALSGAKAKNIKTVRALLDTDKLRLNKDGTLTGLSEQLDKIRNENDYLFEAEKAPELVPHFLGGSHGTPPFTNDDAVRAIMGLPPASK